MRIISSQRYVDFDIVAEKIEEMESLTSITLPIINAGMKNDEGEDLYILIDGHHRREAAKELEIEVVYEEIENDSNLTGEDLLADWYMGDDWYYIDSENYVW